MSIVEKLTHLTEQKFKEKTISILINNFLKDYDSLAQYYDTIKKKKNPNHKNWV